jgi:hypothetical protein
MAILVMISLSVTAHVAALGRTASRKAQAQSIADATALAGVLGSRPMAEQIARMNGADLVLFEDGREMMSEGSLIHVVVGISGRQASAWASDGQ